MLQRSDKLEGMQRNHSIVMIGCQQQSCRILKQKKVTLCMSTPYHCIRTQDVTPLYAIQHNPISTTTVLEHDIWQLLAQVNTEYNVRWASQLVWISEEDKNAFFLLSIKPRFLGHTAHSMLHIIQPLNILYSSIQNFPS